MKQNESKSELFKIESLNVKQIPNPIWWSVLKVKNAILPSVNYYFYYTFYFTYKERSHLKNITFISKLALKYVFDTVVL